MKLITILMMLTSYLSEDKIVINKSYEVTNPEKMVVRIDNINGDVLVEPSNDNKVYLELEIRIFGSNEQLIEKAKEELELGESVTDDSIIFFTKAPFIRRSNSQYGMNEVIKEPKYRWRYQYKVRVPKNVTIDASTVNNGNVKISSIDGAIKAANVNGKVDIENARRVLKANTVNGDLTINFLESPTENVKFNTVNGDFIFRLPQDFSAKIYFNSMNGEMYTAFDYAKIPAKVKKSETKGTFKIDLNSGIEIGSNGPELSFGTVNGNLYLKEAE